MTPATRSGSPIESAPAQGEFGDLEEICEERGLRWTAQPAVERRCVLHQGRRVSCIVWGENPDLVLLHGGAQNSHTWDAFALALGRPAVAVDLPGHGHSDWWESYSTVSMASAVLAAADELAPNLAGIVGIGLGASVALMATSLSDRTVDQLVMVDSTAGTRIRRSPAGSASVVAAQVTSFTSKRRYSSFEEMLERAAAYSPGRSPAGLRRGLTHNAVQSLDGSWTWRWDPRVSGGMDYQTDELASALDTLSGRILVVAGGASDVVTEEAVADLASRHRSVSSVTIGSAEHGVQGTHPVELADVIGTFLKPQEGLMP